MIAAPADSPPTRTRHREGIRLSVRELNVLKMIAEGHSSKEAAELLYVSKRTVDFHLSNIYLKLGVGNRTRAVIVASSLGFLPKPQ